MTSHRLVRATLERMPEVARVMRVSYRATYPDFAELHSADEDRAYVADILFARCEIHLAEADGKILGFIAFGGGMIEQLYLLPSAQRRGIGGELLAIAKASAPRLRAWTFACNASACAFYRRHGFVEIEATDGAGNEERQPDVLLEWTVGR